MKRVWIGVGSNLGNPKKQIDRALWALSKIPITKLLIFSSYYQSYPLNGLNQPCFLNLVAVLKTHLYPEALLNHIQYIEHEQGRIRNNLIKRWMPRTLDLDILLFDKYTIRTNKLIIPHYDMMNREFVLYPLMELDEDFIFPNGLLIKNIIKTIPKRGLTVWNK